MFGWLAICGPVSPQRCGVGRAPVGDDPGCAAAPTHLLDGLGEPADEYAAAQILFRLRFPNGWGCAECGHLKWTHLRSRPRIFECNRCGRAHSVTAGTALHRCRIPLVKVVAAARLLCRAGVSVSARALARILDLGVEAAWMLGHRLRAGFLDATPVRLDDDVVLSYEWFRRRKERGERRGGVQRPLAWFSVLWDWSHRAAGATGSLDPFEARRFVDRHTAAATPIWGPLMFTDPDRIGNRTHRGVSERWLSMYVAAIFAWRNARIDGRDPPSVALQAALRCDRFPFRRLRPMLPYRRPTDAASEAHAAAHHQRLWRTSVLATLGDEVFERYRSCCAAPPQWCVAADGGEPSPEPAGRSSRALATTGR